MTKPSYVLRIRRAKQPPADMEIDAGRVTVGREVADIALHDPACSSKHAEILFASGVVTLRDLGSTNGTWVAGKRITEEVMAPGLVFTIGGGTVELIAVNGIQAQFEHTLIMPGPAGSTTAAGSLPRPQPAVEPQPFVPLRQRRGFPWRSVAAALLAIGGIAALVIVLQGRAGNGGRPGPTRLTQGREATVKAVWWKGPIGPDATGGTSATTIRISPGDKNVASVGVLEEFAGGAGNQWRTATWLAASSASQLAGHSLTDHEFLVRTTGHIDGPSAGMLMTATMLALLRGKTPRADTTLTGTINPDGSIGPVGGIAQKIAAAKKDGLLRFGFPMGTRSHIDLRTGATVDLFDLGTEAGIEVVEIRDIFDAYQLLTDDRLERPVPVAESDMELDGDTTARLRSKNEKWAARLRTDIASLGSVARGLGALGENIQLLARQADAAWERAQEFSRTDFPASAYESRVRAALLATMTKDAARLLKAAAAGDTGDMVTQVEAAATVKGQLAAMLGEAELQARRKTVGGQINTVRAFQSAVVAEAFAALADAAVADANPLLEAQKKGLLRDEQKQQLLQRLYLPILHYSIAKTMLEVAEDQRDFGSEEGESPPVGTRVIDRFAAAYASAAGAVQQYLESLTIEEAAREAAVDKATAPLRLAQNDNDYLLAARAVRMAEGTGDRKAEQSLLRLAAGSVAFLKGASLLNKYYSLGGQRDAKGTLTLGNRKALTSQIDLGRQLAREAAAKARAAVGFVPIASRLAYQLGRAKRDGNDDEKLEALEAFWESAFWSELAASSPAAGRK